MVVGREVHRSTWNDSRNCVFVNHLSNGIPQENYVLIERFDLTLQFNPVNQINRHRDMFTAQGVEKRVLQELTFVIAHDIFRVQKLISFEVNTR